MARFGLIFFALLATATARDGRYLRQVQRLDVGLSHSSKALLGDLQTPATRVTSRSWGDQLMGSFFKFLMGIVAVTFSVPILWINERRSARMESVISRGRRCCTTVNSAEKDNRGRLVHTTGATRAAAVVADSVFSNVSLESCIRLRTIVQVFQHIEHEHKTTERELGGRETQRTTYTYSQEWTSVWHDSGSFRAQAGRHNRKPPGLDPRTNTVNCSRVEYGDGFVLPDELVDQLGNFEQLSSDLGEEIIVAASSAKLHWDKGSCWYYLRDTAPETSPAEVAANPEIGDARVQFEVVRPGQATVLALQAPGQGGEAVDTFLPFRSIYRGICGLSEDEEKRRLLEQGNRSRSDLGNDDTCSWGPFAGLCCACNLVSFCMSAVMQPELFHCFTGELSAQACFTEVQGRNKFVTWVMRFLGWLLMFGGLYAVFSPFLTLLAVVPFLHSFGSGLIWVLCLVTTLVLASLIVSLAYLAYHPLVSFAVLLLGGLVVAAPKLIALAMAAAPA